MQEITKGDEGGNETERDKGGGVVNTGALVLSYFHNKLFFNLLNRSNCTFSPHDDDSSIATSSLLL